ncbi:MAG: VOC family protein [Candidatus Rariloculaceae bacterium]
MTKEVITDLAAQKTLNAALTPMRLSEVVIYTQQFKTMVDWYEIFLGQEPNVLTADSGAVAWEGNKGVAFFRIYADFPWTEVFGIFEFPDMDTSNRDKVGYKGPGIHHFQVRIPVFDDFMRKYEALSNCGIEPKQSFNHGPGSSFYYNDPDGNFAEISTPNFDKQEDYLAYFQTEAYQKNFDGVEIDPAEFLRKYRDGVSRDELVRIEV